MTVPELAQQAGELFAERASPLTGDPGVFIRDLSGISDGELAAGVESSYLSMLTGPAPAISRHDLIERLANAGITPEFVGSYSVRPTGTPSFHAAVCRGSTPPAIRPAPPSFRVVAVMPVFNESDIVELAIGNLVANGVDVYLLDNWSTDDTAEKARSFSGRGLIGEEKFPQDGPPSTYELAAIKRRIEEIAADVNADWVILSDADEVRSAPWPGVTLKDALFHVQEQGFSSVNYTLLNFALTADTFRPGMDITKELTWFRPEPTASRTQLNTWRKLPGRKAEFAWSGGHEVRFDGQTVFPYNFLLRHYPIRSLEQGRRKVFQERLPRFSVEERLKGWHDHYDRFKPSQLLEPVDGLAPYDSDFMEKFLFQRLTGRGFERPAPSRTVKTKIQIARALRRAGLLDRALALRWRYSGRASK